MPSARILIVDDEQTVREGLEAWLGRDHDVAIAGGATEALALLQGAEYDLAVVDQKMPGMDGIELLREIRRAWPQTSVVLMTAYGSVESAVDAMRSGAADYICKPFTMEALELVIGKALGWRAMEAENRQLKRQLEGREDFHGMVTRSAKMRSLFRVIERIAATDAPVLVTGENGTGKELVARAVHLGGSRAAAPFVAVSCGAYPETLLEAELFGHEKGAYTGAVAARPGLLETAGEGTLFLDEIGELSPKAQVDLLRVLQEREFRRIGATRVSPFRARVVAATHRNLARMVEQGTFRQDLYYRLRIVPLVVPPLRERREDIPLLAEHFLGRFARAYNKDRLTLLPPSSVRALMRYGWPGNVRELEGVIHQAVILATGEEVTLSELPEEVTAGSRPAGGDGEPGAFRDRVAAFEKELIEAALQRAGGVKRAAAEELGLSQRALSYYLSKYGL